MIRITPLNECSATRLFLEGKLAGVSVDELDKCWQSAKSTPTELIVDLTSVDFIDARGKQLLIEMHQRGARLIASSLMSKCIIEEINNGI